MITRLVSLAVLSVIACSACANEPPKRKPVREYDSATPRQPAPPPAQLEPLPDVVRDAVQADAAKRANTTADQIGILSAEKQTWSDGALGCAKPGQMYTQAIVPGYRVWARAGERILIYHTSETGSVVLCPSAVRQIRPNDTVAE